MKKKILLLTALFLFLTPNKVFAKEPAFLDKDAVQKSLQETEMSKEEYNAYFEEESEESILVKYAPGNVTKYPASFDPRKTGTVTGVKNQTPYGACWAYGAVATAESALIKQGYADNSIDLSELQYTYSFWKEKYEECDYADAFQKGGASIQVWQYMTKGVGPYYESAFGSLQDYTGEEIADDLLHSRLYDLDSIYYTGYDGTNADAVKSLIVNYGGAAMNYYSSNKYYISNPVNAADDTYNNTGDSTYYNPHPVKMINHMVEIVGWDDNYPAENFKNKPSGNGAWLIKGSWGENYLADFDENLEIYLSKTGKECASPTGYYWISYYEYSMQNIAIVGVEFTQKDTTPTEIRVKEDNLTLLEGDTVKLEPTVLPETALEKGVTYASGDETVASVTKDGLVTAKGCGETTITIASKDILDEVKKESWVTKEVTVSVRTPMIAVAESSITMKKGDTKQLEIETVPADAKLGFSSGNSDIVSVDENGILTAKKTGTITIKIQMQDYDVSQNILITVTEDETSETPGTSEEQTTKELPSEEKTTNESTTQQISSEQLTTTEKAETTQTPPATRTSENLSSENTKPGGNLENSSVKTEKATEIENTETVSGKTVVEKISAQPTKWKTIKRKKNKITLRWKKITGINGYRIQYATNNRFKKAKTVYVSKKATSKTISVKQSKKYYIRIQTYKMVNGKRYTSKWIKKVVKK